MVNHDLLEMSKGLSVFTLALISAIALLGVYRGTKYVVYAQKFIGDSSSVLSNLSGLGDFASSASTSPLSNMPFDLGGLGNLFAGKSILGTIGVSMVDNVSVSGIQLINGSTISVTLSHGTGNNLVPPVTVIAYKISLNNTDVSTIIKSMGNNTASAFQNNSYLSDNLTGQSERQLAGLYSNQPNPFAILEKIQIGSSSLTNSGWTSPHTLTMGMIKSAIYPTNFDLILVMAIPYTGIREG